MYYTIYKITNLINSKIYIGKHKTEDLEDGYMGSGLILKKAIEKYGLENFEKEIIHIFNSEDEMNRTEYELVNESFIKRKDTYNLKIGGQGGWDYINDNNLSSFEKCNEKGLNNSADQYLIISKRIKNDKELWLIQSNKIKEGLKTYYDNGGQYNFRGKTHSEKTKKLMSDKAKLRVGDKNSQYGTVWVYNDKENRTKKIKKEHLEQHLKYGWRRGRK